MPSATDANIDKFLQPLIDTMINYHIDTGVRMAAFLAQLTHESGSLRYVKELASGEAYEGRLGLGNVNPGDGVKFKGRGLIQITGRTNYKLLSIQVGIDFVEHPELLEDPHWAAWSAGWFWNTRKLNLLADIATDEAFEKITRRINGGLTHHQQRKGNWIRCMRALN